ncbi:MAG: NAD-dependent epimerase/dehydratase family protein [Chitinophagales bacterium]|nr:NAD-dependent epimerase/dehydratase family protein [Chitinophagales bacterium]
MNILITGGAGYIGTELINKLSKNNSVDQLIVYDNLSRGNYNFFLGKNGDSKKIKFVNGDILDSRSIRKVLKGIDVVYHLAAKVTTPFANIDSHFFEQINHWGTAELVYAIEESKVKKVIFTSSASIYGSSSVPSTEETPPHPTSFYGISKQRGEEHVVRLFEKIPTVIVRCGNVYGYSKSMRFDVVINRFMFDAHFAGRVTINGSGTQSRSFIHISKVAHVLAELLNTEVPSGIYNLSDKNLEILDILSSLKNIYQDLEYFHINQHITMQELKVEPRSKLYQFISLPISSLEDELKNFREQFAF